MSTQTSPQETLMQDIVPQINRISLTEEASSSTATKSLESQFEISEEMSEFQPATATQSSDSNLQSPQSQLEKSTEKNEREQSNSQPPLKDLYSTQKLAKNLSAKNARKTYTKRDHMNRHVKTYYKIEKIKEWPCKICSDLFTYDNLSNHYRTYENKRSTNPKEAHAGISTERYDMLSSIASTSSRSISAIF